MVNQERKCRKEWLGIELLVSNQVGVLDIMEELESKMSIIMLY